MPDPRRPSAVRTYGSKPRKVSSTHLWDGSRDVPRRLPLAEHPASKTNERTPTTSAIGGFVKGVVNWLSPQKARKTVPRKTSGKENALSTRAPAACLSDDDDHEDNDADTSIASTADTLIASTPKKDSKATPEPKTGLDLLLQFCVEDRVLDFSEHLTDLLTNASVRKLGEASFSEVFTIKHQNEKASVLKIVPFNHTADEIETPASTLEDILQELRISNTMSKVDGFADFQGYLSFAASD